MVEVMRGWFIVGSSCSSQFPSLNYSLTDLLIPCIYISRASKRYPCSNLSVCRYTFISTIQIHVRVGANDSLAQSFAVPFISWVDSSKAFNPSIPISS